MIESRAIRHFDPFMVILATILVAYGAVLIYSASLNSYPEGVTLSHPVVKQIVFAVFGVGVMAVIAWLDYRIFGQMAAGLYVLAVLMLAGVMVMGNSAYGSTRWFNVAGQQIQASEVAKLLVIVALARYLADRRAQMDRVFVFVSSLAMAAVPAALVMAEPDMGTAMVFGAVWVGMVLVAGAPPRFVLVFLGLAVSFIPFGMLAVMGDYQRHRFALWVNPNSDPLGGGFNILQSEIGIGSGGILGKGLTHGTQVQLDFLQTSTTDYIFSVLGEELGLIGAVLLFALYAFLLFRGIRTAQLAQDQFGRLLATGIVIMILFQVFINVGVNVRLVPVTGIPLPFISQGGSSMVMMFAALGLLEGVLIRHKKIEF